MRFWITKNSALPVREQLVRQVMLGILSEDLPAGHKLPSIRELARRCRIHSNTVSAAYHDLLDRGWLELRRGSGLYVRLGQPSATGELDALLTDLLRAARTLGHEPEAVLHRLEQMVLPRRYQRIAIVEPEPGLREILLTEVAEHISIPTEAIPTEAIEPAQISETTGAFFAALPTRAIAVRERLPRGVPLMTLRLNSVGASLERQTRPGPNTIVAIVSRSPEFRYWARAVLLAVGLDPECVCEVDTALEDWQERAAASAVLVADVVAARRLPPGRPAKVFRLIADSCLAEMKQLCGA